MKRPIKLSQNVEIEIGQKFLVINLHEAHDLHDKLTEFINDNPLPDEEDED